LNNIDVYDVFTSGAFDEDFGLTEAEVRDLSIYLRTLKHLRITQIVYRFYYAIRGKGRGGRPKNYSHKKFPINLLESLNAPVSYIAGNTFVFLNQQKHFDDTIDWNYTGYGMLWAYNLNYFEFLHQRQIDRETGLCLIRHFIDQHDEIRIGYDPYPIALRNVFWIRFLVKHKIEDERIDSFLYETYRLLLRNLEYHILGNHLLENGFSLLWSACYFCDDRIYRRASGLLKSQLDEQILIDGAHFELSPMYHQIILYRLLDCVNLLRNNKCFDDQEDLLAFMTGKARRMLAWLNAVTFANGAIPLLNDAAPGIAPGTDELNRYALDLRVLTSEEPQKLKSEPPKLSDSGYRCFKTALYECLIDIGQIGPSYQPGHAHADTFNFVLNVHGKPLIVDTGISTYNAGETRQRERGTAAHNTVTVLDQDSSEVWASFRVGRRAMVTVLEDTAEGVTAEHDGYRSIGTKHRRSWAFGEKEIAISDELTGREGEGRAYLHLAPGIQPGWSESAVNTGSALIRFEGGAAIRMTENEIPEGYNRYVTHWTIEAAFERLLKTTISLK